MIFFANVYQKTLAENEKNKRFWEDYLANLKALDFNAFADKLRVPVLVPVGNRILFRGELKHTNEITVALGADYFAKCSVKQAEVLRQHRIKDAESKLENFKREREYIENQVLFRKENIFEEKEQEIIEFHTEEEDRIWRERHRQNMKKWKQEVRQQDNDKTPDKITDEKLWEKLEELELREELENELAKDETVLSEKDIKKSFEVTEDNNMLFKNKETLENSNDVKEESKSNQTTFIKPDKKVKFIEPEAPKVRGKFELLQKVMDKQNELEGKLLELRNKERSKSKTEQDLIAKLDEMDELEEMQDEMERLEDIIDTEDVTSEEELEEENSETTSQSQQADIKRRVSFADEDNSETLELSFYHSDIEPCNEPYDPKIGITKPSDVYEVFSNNFIDRPSILKKSKYEDKNSDVQIPKVEMNLMKKKVEWPEDDDVERRTIVVKDIVEKDGAFDKKLDGTARPTSLFKQRRQQKK